MDSIEQRVDQLEERIAHQDKMIGELNDVITDQWKKLAAMERQLQRFGEELESVATAEAPVHQKPPHY